MKIWMMDETKYPNYKTFFFISKATVKYASLFVLGKP